MICYRCGNKLGAGRHCLRCGADVTLYRKIVRTSNSYYNAGLDKAELRDLTGAIECLETCLQYNKNHIEARNLLGLIYFEMGEIAEALSHWLISSHLQPENNRANEYLAYLKQEQNMLDDMNQAVKKYNQALEQARIDGPDLAIITLKRVLKQQPNMLKAYQLLALLYINEQDYSKANRLLKRALEIDKGNTLCQTYSRQIRGKLGSGGRRPRREEKQKQKRVMDSLQFKPREKTISRLVEGDEDESLVPTVKESSGLAKAVVSFILGMGIALCMFQFVVLPTVKRNATVAENDRILVYDTKLADKELQLQRLQEQIDNEAADREEWQAQMASYTGEEGVITQYNLMLDIMKEYSSEDRSSDAIVASFKKLKKGVVQDETFNEMYQTVYSEIIAPRVSRSYQNGVEKVDEGDYSDAREYFEACLELNPDYDKAIYYLGVCAKKLGDTEKANEYFAKIVLEYRDSDFYDAAVDEVGENPASGETDAENQGESSGNDTAEGDSDEGDSDSNDEDSEDDEDWDDEEE